MLKHEGALVINEENRKDFSELQEVTGFLRIDAEASLPALTTVGDSLIIDAEASLPALTTVGDSLIINAEASLPALTTVGYFLRINAEASLPALTTVGDFLSINAEASLPALTTVGFFLIINAEASLPALTTAHGVKGRLLAVSTWGLWYSEGRRFYAGCKGPLTKEQALNLSETYEDQEIAKLFASAIRAL